MDDVRWERALLNGLYVWLLSLVIWALPAVLYAYSLSTGGGSDAADSATLLARLGGAIGALYGQNWLLIVALIVITSVLVFWRARVVARGTWNLRWVNGLIVGAVPAVLSLSFGLCGGWSWWPAPRNADCRLVPCSGPETKEDSRCVSIPV
jgi:hypothetical protein